MKIGIVDIGIGNIGSLKNALHCQGWDSFLISKPEDFNGITHLILPGVGAFSAAIKRLHESRLFDRIKKFANEGSPVMGICLGMQLLADCGTEGGVQLGLGLIPGRIVPIQALGLRLPHVGWNTAQQAQRHRLLEGIRNEVDFYFVHSYRYMVENNENILANTDYGEIFPSIVGKGNVVVAQFHPEKSQANGLRLLDNFCLWDGKC
jgi:glutamine amidotransferase